MLSRTRPRRLALLAPGQRIRAELFFCGAGASGCGNEIKGGARASRSPSPGRGRGCRRRLVAGSRARRPPPLRAPTRIRSVALVMSYPIVVVSTILHDCAARKIRRQLLGLGAQVATWYAILARIVGLSLGKTLFVGSTYSYLILVLSATQLVNRNYSIHPKI